MKDPVVLKVYRGKRLIAVKQYLNSQIVIGRQGDSGLALDDESVSPLHAVIEERDDAYYVSDLGSESGIRVEGAQVLETALESGEAIEIGPYSVRFYIGVPKPPVPPNYEKDHTPPAPNSETPLAADVTQVEAPPSSVTPEETTELDPPSEKTNFESAEKEVVEAPDRPENVEEEMLELPVTPDGHMSFDDEEEESTDPGVYVEQEATSPGFDSAPVQLDEPVEEEHEIGVKIASRDVEEVLQAQRIEPVSSGYVAPESSYSSVDEIIYPYSRGSVLEVVVAWRERILKTYHFSNTENIFLTNTKDDSRDVYAPLSGPDFRHPLLTFKNDWVVNIASTMSGEIYYDNKTEDLATYASHSNAITSSGKSYQLQVDQGQMVKLNLLGDNVSAYIRFVEDTPEVAMAPVFDFSPAEIVGIFMSLASVLVIALYMLFYVPSTLDDTQDLLEDRLTKATITFKPPPKIQRPPTPVEPIPEPPKEKKVVKVAEKKAPKKVKQQLKAGSPKKANIGSDKKAGKPKAAAPSRVKTANKAGSSRPGGSVNTGKDGANMKSAKKDLTKTGILGVLSGGGANAALDKASSGVGTTIGLADQKTGYQGQASDHVGDGIGTKLQIAGKGGSGSSLAGVGDLSTSGRGGGQTSYGAGGLGGKGSTTILAVDGLGDDFSSTIDKDAIRRLIRRNKNALAGCYERALDQNSKVSGKVVLSWRIVQGGKMVSPKVKSSTLKNSQVEQCIISRLMVLTFPDPGPNEIAEVDYPFVFKPSN